MNIIGNVQSNPVVELHLLSSFEKIRRVESDQTEGQDNLVSPNNTSKGLKFVS